SLGGLWGGKPNFNQHLLRGREANANVLLAVGRGDVPQSTFDQPNVSHQHSTTEFLVKGTVVVQCIPIVFDPAEPREAHVKHGSGTLHKKRQGGPLRQIRQAVPQHSPDLKDVPMSSTVVALKNVNCSQRCGDASIVSVEGSGVINLATFQGF